MNTNYETKSRSEVSRSVRIRQLLSLIVNIVIVLMEIFATGMSIMRQGAGLFLFYTEDSNLLALFACAILAVYTADALLNRQAEVPEWVRAFKYTAVCTLSVTIIVVLTILAPTIGEGGYRLMMLSGSMLYHHFLCPVLAAASFLLLEHKPQLNKTHTLIAMLPTLLYAVVTIILNLTKTISGPYPFLKVLDQPIFMSLMWFVLILGGAYLLAYLLRIGSVKLSKIWGD